MAQRSTTLNKPVAPTQQLAQLRANGVAILDFGAQYTKVIDRRVRALNIYCEILPLSTPVSELDQFGALVLSGGPHSVFEADAPHFDPEVLTLNKPLLGICYGMQWLVHHSGGKVEAAQSKEYGQTTITVDPATPLFDGLSAQQAVLMSHGDHVLELPDGFEQIGQSPSAVAAVRHAAKRHYGVQFHPEVDLTEHGQTMINNFLTKVAGLKPDFTLPHRLDDIVGDIRRQVGHQNVIVLVSGGVDSAVTAALLLKALDPKQVYAVHMNTGFMRHEESESVCTALRNLGLTHLLELDCADDFFNATTTIDEKPVGPLSQTLDPEEKRRLMGDMFFSLTQSTMNTLNLDMDHTFIAQGTLRPDLIESGSVEVSAVAHKIKTHHNDVPIIQAQREKGLIVEPNRDLHKDEVRQIGSLLGLPDELVHRQPFPGPGLAIRTICTDAPYGLDQAKALMQTITPLCSGLSVSPSLLPIRSVGVQGDFRSYRQPLALCGPFKTIGWEALSSLAQRLTNDCHGLNRVTLVLNPDAVLPPIIETITPTTLTPATVALLRAIDHHVTTTLQQAGRLDGISQLLSVLLPIDTMQQGRHSVVIRGVVTNDYMTARPVRPGDELPWPLLQDLDAQLRARFDLDLVLLDITAKPPATVEWE